MRTRRRLSIIGMALALSACSGESSIDDTAQAPETVDTSPDATSEEPATTATTESPKARVGSTVSLEGQEDGVKVDATVVKVVDPAPPGDFLTPKGRIVAIQIKLTNTGTRPYDDSPGNGAKLVDGDGQSFNATTLESGAGPAMGTVTITPGDSRLGFVSFDVPKEAVLSKFQLALDSGFANETGEWLLG